MAQADSILTQLNPKNLNVLFIRHGQAGVGKPFEKYLGGPLTKMGLKQAQKIGKRLATVPFDHLYSSDMARSYQTALAISQ